MSFLSRRSVKTGAVTAATVAALATVAPATASADPVDRALAALPAGEITCEQANEYWTTEAQYDSIAAQARAVAVFHPRGGEIRDALARVDEAADRCGLKGGGTANPAPAPGNGGSPAPQAPANNKGPAPVGQVITVPVAPGTPTVNVPVGDVATFVIPDVLQIVADFFAQFGVGSSR
ncbi:hypothetical protein [Corynebacterium halotolerans]|uniref:Secreted protein n=1 Tax=Corynebacterium halotolerans YIM 70093 = DSM 44683 TaxID=1121362 RepID=M1P2Z8_9CORY|nr:hypothetical protein [Corynebacterium halotolerans]AGF71051.1 hypothetical protein A605_00165 [Corynebacterium halotolerans YIM 70093 = DSM 44683]